MVYKVFILISSVFFMNSLSWGKQVLYCQHGPHRIKLQEKQVVYSFEGQLLYKGPFTYTSLHSGENLIRFESYLFVPEWKGLYVDLEKKGNYEVLTEELDCEKQNEP